MNKLTKSAIGFDGNATGLDTDGDTTTVAASVEGRGRITAVADFTEDGNAPARTATSSASEAADADADKVGVNRPARLPSRPGRPLTPDAAPGRAAGEAPTPLSPDPLREVVTPARATAAPPCREPEPAPPALSLSAAATGNATSEPTPNANANTPTRPTNRPQPTDPATVRRLRPSNPAGTAADIRTPSPRHRNLIRTLRAASGKPTGIRV